MATIATLAVNITGNVASLKGALSEAQGAVRATGKSMQDFGKTLSLGVTAPLVAAGGLAVKAATDLNASMANVASLGVATERVNELKTAVQDMAIEVGKSTGDLSDGLYQVVSAFGDSADTVQILEINAKAAAAGIATTTDAINLTSAVTKGYGDTSAEAVQKASDLAFVTVKLGQTTFPELAASMGKVVPIAASLGISQEELFASMATLTGVTGGAAEVSTQLRATYQALLKPTTEMAGAIADVAYQLDAQGKLVDSHLVDAWRMAEAQVQKTGHEMAALQQKLTALGEPTKTNAKEFKALEKAIKDKEKAMKDDIKAVDAAAAALGQALIESVGFSEAIALINAQADGNTDTMGKMYGSVEALTAVLALTGGQADTFQEKLSAMQEVTGATDEAFAAQTEGVNKLGFMYQQAQARLQVFREKMGDAIGAVLLPMAEVLEPLGDRVLALADRFANMDPIVRQWIVVVGMAAAALGPLLLALGTVVSAFSSALPVIGALAGTFGLLISPIGLVVAALAALVAFDVGGIRTKLTEAITAAAGEIGPIITQLVTWFQTNLPIALATAGTFFASVWSAIPGYITAASGVISPIITRLVTWFQTSLPIALSTVSAFFASVWSAIPGYISTALGVVGPIITQLVTWFQTNLPIALARVSAFFASVWAAIPGYISTALSVVGPIITQLVTWFQTSLPIALARASAFFAGVWSAIPGYITTALGVVGPIITQMVNWFQVNLPIALATVSAFFAGAWSAIPGYISTALSVVGPIITQLVTWFQTSLPIALATVSVFFAGGWSAIPGYISTALGVVGPIVTQLVTWFQTDLPAALSVLVQFFGPSIGRIGAAFVSLGAQVGTLGPSLQALWEAAQPALMALGAAVAAVALLFNNLLAAAIENLVPVIQAVIDQVTNTLNLITSVVTGVATAIVAIANGDWATAWAAFGQIGTDFIEALGRSIANFAVVASALIAFAGTAISNTLRDLGFEGVATAIDTAITKVKEFLEWVGKLVTGQIEIDLGTVFSTPDWVTSLLEWDWPDITELGPDWWPEITELGSDWWPEISKLGSDWWPSITKLGSDWWPSITKLGSDWWPKIPTPAWLDTFIGAIKKINPLAFLTGDQLGTAYSHGGPTWVGEGGREIVLLPRGAQVIPNREAESMAAGGWGGPLAETIVVRSEQDLYRLAYQITEIQQRRARRR
ncbi:MAG: phage tail tape measure protein [Chloroflexi bacterium]|nr:MAG: phage tail tape measure protein [Chloroflexota bacterium]